MKKRLAMCVALCALLAGGRAVKASTALVGDVHASELRVAYASAEWTTIWTSFRIDDAGPFAVIVPLPDGAFVDQSTDAFFEALDAATAVRVHPQDGLNLFCPGESGSPNPVDVTGALPHTDSLAPQAIALLDTAPDLAAWATTQGLSLQASVQNALAALPAKRYLAVRFTSPGGGVTTPTLRVSSKTGLPTLPFSITKAGSSNLRVTSYLLGEGRGTYDGVPTLPIDPSNVAWNAKTQVSDYLQVRDDYLALHPEGSVLESASHESLVKALPVDQTGVKIGYFVDEYFKRAADYGAAASSDVATCVDDAKFNLQHDAPFSPACPRGDLASPETPCPAPVAGPDQIASSLLTCGPAADDLAIALAGKPGVDAVLTRRILHIAQGAFGTDQLVAFGAGPDVTPVMEVNAVDVSDCFGSGGSGGAGGATGTTTNGQGGYPQGGGGIGAVGGYGAGAGYDGGSYHGGSDTYVYVDPGCSCNGTVDTGGTDTGTYASGDDCSGDTGSTAYSGDDCSGDTGSVDYGGDDCSSDTTGADACSGDSAGADACSGDSVAASDCSIRTVRTPEGAKMSPKGRRFSPRLSALTLAAMALILPLRRRGTRKRRPS